MMFTRRNSALVNLKGFVGSYLDVFDFPVNDRGSQVYFISFLNKVTRVGGCFYYMNSRSVLCNILLIIIVLCSFGAFVNWGCTGLSMNRGRCFSIGS